MYIRGKRTIGEKTRRISRTIESLRHAPADFYAGFGGVYRSFATLGLLLERYARVKPYREARNPAEMRSPEGDLNRVPIRVKTR